MLRNFCSLDRIVSVCNVDLCYPERESHASVSDSDTKTLTLIKKYHVYYISIYFISWEQTSQSVLCGCNFSD